MNFYIIRTKTDPDRGLTQDECDQHLLASDTFRRIAGPLFKAAGIEDADHELAEITVQRAAFDTALELGVQLDVEHLESGDLQFTFDFLGSVTFNEVEELDEYVNAGTALADDIHRAAYADPEQSARCADPYET